MRYENESSINITGIDKAKNLFVSHSDLTIDSLTANTLVVSESTVESNTIEVVNAEIVKSTVSANIAARNISIVGSHITSDINIYFAAAYLLYMAKIESDKDFAVFSNGVVYRTLDGDVAYTSGERVYFKSDLTDKLTQCRQAVGNLGVDEKELSFGSLEDVMEAFTLIE